MTIVGLNFYNHILSCEWLQELAAFIVKYQLRFL